MSKSDFPADIQQLIEATASAVAKKLLVKQAATYRVDPQLLTVKETCTYLNCSRATLRRWEDAGLLLPKRFGRKVLYELIDVEAFRKAGSR